MMERSKGRFLQWLHGPSGAARTGGVEDFDSEATARTLGKIDWLFGPKGYLPTSVTGWEHLPSTPVMIVSNHSGGTLIPDVWGFLYSWYRRLGVHRSVHPMGHDMIFAFPSLAEFFSKRGVVRAGRDRALEVLRGGRDLLVLPGGDRETWRPYKDRYKVQFHGRKGYARLALKAGVSIVPLAHAGAHETFRVLTDGAKLARALKFPEIFRAEVFPVHLSLPWGLAVGPWPHIPLPTQLRYRIAAPIKAPALLDPNEEPSAELIDTLDEQVRHALQTELSILGGEMEPPTPEKPAVEDEPTPPRRPRPTSFDRAAM